jgi:hypothetical protein
MIAIEGQYYFKCSTGNKKDFIDAMNLKFFEIVEVSGLILPIFKLVFLTEDDLIVASLHEGQPLNVQFGKSVDAFEDMTLCCNKVLAHKTTDSRHEVTVSGFLGKNNFLSQPKIKITDAKSGVEAVKEVAKSHFNWPATNVQSSKDSMKWIQYNTSDRNFVFDTLMHSYVRNSVLASAICANGDLRVRDIKEDLKKKANKPDWTLSNTSKDEKALKYNPYQVQSAHGLMNTLGRYGYEINTHTPETGEAASYVAKPEVVMALANEVAKNAEVEKRYFGTQMQNKNVHDNFWKAYQQNLVGLLNLSTVKLALPLAEAYRAIKPLDIVMFRDVSMKDDKQSNELYSGLYIVSQVKRTLIGKKCVVVIEICRESINGVKNAN